MRAAGLAAGAAAILLSGCDYWRNLTESKTVTRVNLRIEVKDAWESRPLAGALCRETSRNLPLKMDESGTLVLNDAATGNYSLACQADGYHERKVDFELGGKGKAVTVLLGRRGLSEWYPEEPEKRPRILVSGPLDTLRYPYKFDLQAYPKDSSGNFRFEWTFAESPRLNRGPGSIFASLPFYRMKVDPSDVTNGPDMIRLKVRSRLAGEGGDTGYVVGIDSLPIVWIRNKLPYFEDLRPHDLSLRLGCNELEEFRLTFEAKDPDGACDSVVFHTKDNSQVLGPVHETRLCSDPNPLKLPLRNPFTGPTDYLRTLDETLGISVWDGNGEHFDTSIQFTTYANVLPTITAGKTGTQTEFLTNSRVSVWLEAKDSDGPVERLEIDWGDKQVRNNIILKTTQTDSLRDTIHYNYSDSGTYTITAYVIDACDDTIKTQSGVRVRIRDNTPPSIQIQPLIPLPSDTAYSIRLIIRDKDVEEGMDNYTSILVKWGDGRQYRDSTHIGELNRYSNQLLSHVYAGPPPNGTAYEISVEVKDGQGGTALQYALIPVQSRP